MNPGRVLWQMLHSGAFFGVYTISRLMLALALGKGMASHEYGTYSLISSLAAVLPALVSFSAFQYYTREIPGRPIAQGAALFKSVLAIQSLLLAGLCFGLIMFHSTRVWAAQILGIPGQWIPLLLAAGIFLADSLATDLMRFLFAQCQIERGNLVAFIQTSLWPMVLFGAAVAGMPMTLPLVLVAWISAAATAVGVGIVLAGTNQLIRTPIRLSTYLDAIRFGAPYLLSYAPVAVQALTYFTIAAVYSTEAVGVYAYQYNIIIMLGALAGPVISAPLEPHITEAFNQNDSVRSGKLLGTASKYRLAAVIPLLAIVCVCHEEVIHMLAKPGYAAAPWLMAALAPIPLGMTLSATFERVLFLRRRTKPIGISFAGGAIVQAAAMVVAVPLHPQYGPALAMNIGVFAQIALMWMHARRENIPFRIGAFPLATSAVVAVALAFMAKQWLAPYGGATILFGAFVIVGSGYAIAAYLFQVVSISERQMVGALLRQGSRRVLSLVGGRTR